MTDQPLDPEMFEPVRRAIRVPVLTLIEAERVQPIDAAIGAIYATHDLAMHAGMDGHTAVEWMRTATDLMERQLLERDAARAH